MIRKKVSRMEARQQKQRNPHSPVALRHANLSNLDIGMSQNFFSHSLLWTLQVDDLPLSRWSKWSSALLLLHADLVLLPLSCLSLSSPSLTLRIRPSSGIVTGVSTVPERRLVLSLRCLCRLEEVVGGSRCVDVLRYIYRRQWRMYMQCLEGKTSGLPLIYTHTPPVSSAGRQFCCQSI